MYKEFWRGRSVLVTGATGLLGGWLVPFLVRAGAEVVALVRDGAPRSRLIHDGWSDKIATAYGSVCDEHVVHRTLAEYSVETIFHLAAQTLVGVGRIDPAGTLDTNIRGTWVVLEAARQLRVPSVVVASSDKAYGHSDALPYSEDTPLEAEFPYDVSKACVDRIARSYARTFQLPVGILRCANLFGGGDLNFSRLIPGIIRSVLHNERFRMRSNGLSVRDYLYVEDAVSAYLLLAEALTERTVLPGEAFNVSLELHLTVMNVLQQVLSLMDSKHLQPIIENTATAEIDEQYLSARKARDVLGWTPRFAIEDGLRRTIDWYVSYFASNGTGVAAGA